MTSSPLGLSSIGQISINVHNIQEAVSYYRDILGMKFLFEVPTMAFFDCGGVRIMLGLPESPEFDHPSSVIYFKVQNLQASYDGLVKRGVNFVSKPHLVAPMRDHDLWMAFFKDPDNNFLALMSEVRK